MKLWWVEEGEFFKRDPSTHVDFVDRRKLILLVTFAGRQDDDAGRIVIFSRESTTLRRPLMQGQLAPQFILNRAYIYFIASVKPVMMGYF